MQKTPPSPQEVSPLISNVFLTVDDLAVRWQKSRQWIYSNYRRLGLKVLPIGQQLRFPLREVELWEQSNLRQG
jgi:hypothetical protein